MTAPVSPWIVKPNLINDAARKAARLFPGIIGEVLSREITSLHEFTWLGEGSRAARVLTAVLEIQEGEGNIMDQEVQRCPNE